MKKKTFKEKKDMEEMGMKRELTPEERIEQLEKEKEMLQKQIKNQEKYDEIRKIGDELALYMKALQDSGFSRYEAMRILWNYDNQYESCDSAVPEKIIRRKNNSYNRRMTLAQLGERQSRVCRLWVQIPYVILLYFSFILSRKGD